MAPKILIVLTSVGTLANGGPTGWYLPEFAHPYEILASKAEIVVASPKGGEAPLDPGSVEMFKEDASSANFLANHKSVWENTVPLSSLAGRASEFDAIFFPGGHGPMFDIASDKDAIALTEAIFAAGKPVAGVCHGSVGLVAPKTKEGASILSGRRVTGFSNAEEDTVQMTAAMPFLLEDAIVKAGGKYEKAEEQFGKKVIVDGQIITGQNPASSVGVGEELAKALGI